MSEAPTARAAATAFVIFQRLLPKYLLTRLVYRFTRIRQTQFKNFIIRQFVKAFDVNVDEFDTPLDQFASFNAFFTRELSKGLRPVSRKKGSIVSPVDGTVSALGNIKEGMIFQAKGIDYRLDDLLATDLQDVELYRNGKFMTIYLAPYNYHRVHAPIAGELRAARYVPGDLYSVNAKTVSALPGLFRRNERLVCHFETEIGRCVLIFVGALNVGSITTPWTGEVRPRARGVVADYDVSSAQPIHKGDELGWFNMGSTVILLLPPKKAKWSGALKAGATLEMGEAIGQVSSVADA